MENSICIRRKILEGSDRNQNFKWSIKWLENSIKPRVRSLKKKNFGIKLLLCQLTEQYFQLTFRIKRLKMIAPQVSAKGWRTVNRQLDGINISHHYAI